jgi:hypothetical protein
MPWTAKKLPGGKIRVSSPHGTKSKGTTPEKARKQVALLKAIEHGFDPKAGQTIAAFWKNKKKR